MKSIMEEASTITKAIETAWNRAGQPQEFTVKVLELPKTSFFGLKTAKSAKIALIFNEMTAKIKEHPQKQMRPLRQDHKDQKEERQQPQRRPLPNREPQQRGERSSERSHEGHHARPDQRRQQGPRQPYRSEGQGSDGDQRRHEQRSHERESWTPEMVDAAKDWLRETLVLMGKADIKINSQVSHNYLKLYLDQQVLDDAKQEETQLKSWGSLAMEAVREKVRKPLRSLRIILESSSRRS